MFDAFVMGTDGDPDKKLTRGPFDTRHFHLFARQDPKLTYIFRPVPRWYVYLLRDGETEEVLVESFIHSEDGEDYSVSAPFTEDELRQLFEDRSSLDEHRLTEYVIQPA